MHNSTEFRIGNYRPIYLWAGPGTIRMNQLKFMQVNVDEKVHFDAHLPEGADLVVNRLYQNWIHLTYSWGFPPEIEKEDWKSFQDATKEYHRLGSKVFAYIQTSNCVYSGSFLEKNWYALSPKGKKIYYYSGRYMTCFQNKEWIQYLKQRITDAINRGADGIFFDNLWYGQQPNSLFSTWLGSVGCYCETCQQTYQNETGNPIPTKIDLSNQDVINHIVWRSQKMTLVAHELSEFARSIKSDVIISANDYDPIMRPVKLIFGIDFQALAKIQDVTMIENFALPRWDGSEKNKLVNNALTIRNSQPYLPGQKHLSVLSYDAGIGFDPVYPTRRILTAIAEAAALGCSMTTKGTEYHDGEKMTLLTAPEYIEQQNAIGSLHHWLEDHQDIYQNQARRIAQVGVLHPGDKLWQKWYQLAPIFFACQQTLLNAGIPWRTITNQDELRDLEYLIIFEDSVELENRTDNLKIINPITFNSWQPSKESILDQIHWARNIISGITDSLIRGYHASRSMRKMMDWLGMSKLVTHTPFFTLPNKDFQNELLDQIQPDYVIRVISEHPVLIDIWENKDNELNIHLVNYNPQNQSLELKMNKKSNATVISPDYQELHLSANEHNTFKLDLDLYSICTIRNIEE